MRCRTLGIKNIFASWKNFQLPLVDIILPSWCLFRHPPRPIRVVLHKRAPQHFGEFLHLLLGKLILQGVLRFSKPDIYLLRLFVKLAHQAHMLAIFCCIALVDAYGINLEKFLLAINRGFPPWLFVNHRRAS